MADASGREPRAAQVLSDRAVVALALAASVGAWRSRPTPTLLVDLFVGVAVTLAVALIMGRAARRGSVRPPAMFGPVMFRPAMFGPMMLGLGVFVLANGLGVRAHAGLEPAERRPVAGWVTLRTDPERYGSAVSAVGSFAGRRYLVSAYGRVGRQLEQRLAGELVLIAADQAPLAPQQAERWASRHVVGRLGATLVLDRVEGSAAFRAANRLRRLLGDGAEPLPEIERALFLGLVIGDDRSQTAAFVTEFRRAGLAHLTAVSGQNVAFLLVALAPLIRRLRPAPRWVVTLATIAWFAALTRFEPSVLRATGMAGLAATVFWRGWSASPVRLLSLTVTGFVLIDPLLVHSVGWWMSVGATGGLAVGAAPLAARLPGPAWLREPLGVTLAAQAGVAPVSATVFGTASLVAPVTNLLAVPVAGFVMVWGIPAGLVAGIIPGVGSLVHLPTLLATRWVAMIGRLGALADPGWSPWVVLPIHAGTVVALIGAAAVRDRGRGS